MTVSSKLRVCTLALLVCVALATDRPVIGILDQPLNDGRFGNGATYIAGAHPQFAAVLHLDLLRDGRVFTSRVLRQTKLCVHVLFCPHALSCFPALTITIAVSASYVKYIESAGARVVPIHYNSTTATIANLVNKLNGVLFTGGQQAIAAAVVRAWYFCNDRRHRFEPRH